MCLMTIFLDNLLRMIENVQLLPWYLSTAWIRKRYYDFYRLGTSKIQVNLRPN